MTKLLDAITESRLLLQNPYAYLDGLGGFSALPLSESARSKISGSRRKYENPYAHVDELEDFGSGIHFDASQEINSHKKESYLLSEIEERARNLQVRMWLDRAQIWPGIAPSNPIAILDPSIALKLIGYDFELEETLGQFYSDDKLLEVAGTIDGHLKQVSISRQFQPSVRSFTAAHELGHALLHETGRMHRDRPLDGATLSRDALELEADKFATFFLMPTKLLQATFKRFFLTDKFVLNEETTFALGAYGAQEKKIKTLRQLSRKLASAEQYNGVQFVSLAAQFGVSIEAMAIRLEELELLSI